MIRNFLQIVLGSGKNDKDEEDMCGTNHRRRDDFGDAGRRMSVDDIHALLKPQTVKDTAAPRAEKKEEGGGEGRYSVGAHGNSSAVGMHVVWHADCNQLRL